MGWMPPIGEVAGWRAYVYMEQNHKTPHFHLRKAGVVVSLLPDGAVLAGALPAGDLRVVREWASTRTEAIIQAFNDVQEGKSPQWIP